MPFSNFVGPYSNRACSRSIKLVILGHDHLLGAATWGSNYRGQVHLRKNGKRCQRQFPPVLMSCRIAFGAAEFSLTPFLCRFGLVSGARCYLRFAPLPETGCGLASFGMP